MKSTHYTEMDSPLGTLTLCGTERGLAGLFMHKHRHGPEEDARHEWQRDDALFVDARAELEEYFDGRRRVFTVAIDRDAIEGTPFQRRVWKALEEIPYGVTISYGELARRIEQPTAVRAVGLANGRNPISIIVPCHRVIGANGKLTGYGGGMERKQRLLEMEGAVPAGGTALLFRAEGRASARPDLCIRGEYPAANEEEATIYARAMSPAPHNLEPL